jgi:GNAT superfamily N-acetyltransferase
MSNQDHRADEAPAELPLDIQPCTAERWSDVCALFGERGAQGGCWCMWWRLNPKEFKQNAGARNRETLKQLVDGATVPGLLAYQAGQPIGWCSFAPQKTLLRLPRSTAWKPIDAQPAWSIICFFVDPAARGQRVASRLLDAAIGYLAAQGAQLIEAYPKDIGDEQATDRSLYFGTIAMFQAAGFVEVARRLPAFPIMRLQLS